MIFIDTSAFYALADRADPRHGVARRRLEAAVASGEGLLTHNYVLVETTALLHRRLGLKAALEFARSARAFEMEWIDQDLHEAAVESLARSAKRGVSLVDHVSFLVMRARRVQSALAFDEDFVREGFRLYGGS